ncbi:MAG TPA: alanyl-tRNA editing protein [Candidatus Methylomirabilis sp.]|nr:alanyl-tRNA editing protein [Candidatus Methylomirabilis sp.]
MLPAYEREPYLRLLWTEVQDHGIERGHPFVVLADTILYPEGGGQPSDRGRIADAPVEVVRKLEGRIRHYLAGPPPGGRVQVELDWTRRFDHMQQHTGQHLLTAVAQDRFGWHTTAFHLGQSLSDIELDVPKAAPAELEALEEAVAIEIRAARPVSARRVSPEVFATLPVRTRGLPEGHEGDIRLVEIAGVDLNTCGGTHVTSTAEIEALKLLDTESMRGGTRLFYVAGGRLRHLLASHHERTARLRQLVGASDEELVMVVGAKLDQLKAAQRSLRLLEEELAVEAARALAAGTEKLASSHWDQRDLPFLQQVAREFIRLAPDRLALFTAGAGEEGCFLLCAGEGARIDLAALGREVAGILGGRGGGAGRAYQGKAAALSHRGDALSKLRTLVQGS